MEPDQPKGVGTTLLLSEVPATGQEATYPPCVDHVL